MTAQGKCNASGNHMEAHTILSPDKGCATLWGGCATLLVRHLGADNRPRILSDGGCHRQHCNWSAGAGCWLTRTLDDRFHNTHVCLPVRRWVQPVISVSLRALGNHNNDDDGHGDDKDNITGSDECKHLDNHTVNNAENRGPAHHTCSDTKGNTSKASSSQPHRGGDARAQQGRQRGRLNVGHLFAAVLSEVVEQLLAVVEQGRARRLSVLNPPPLLCCPTKRGHTHATKRDASRPSSGMRLAPRPPPTPKREAPVGQLPEHREVFSARFKEGTHNQAWSPGQ